MSHTMRPKIRVIYKTRPPSFSEQLEQRARLLVRSAALLRASSITARALEQQISLTLGQLDHTRWAHEQVRRNLNQQEIYIETEIMQREPRVPVYEDTRLPQRDMLRGRLLQLGAEKRRLILAESDAVRSLHERLLELMMRSDLLRLN